MKNSNLQVNMFAWRVNQQKRRIHKGEINKAYVERPRLRTV